jgi:AmmeMemoRadiSam system protein B
LWPQTIDDCEAIGRTIARCIQEDSQNTLIVASSDMNHYENATIGNAKDRLAIDQILDLNPRKLFETVRQNDISMCGMVPTTIMLFATLALGASQATLIEYRDSGDASGDKNSVVGYAGLTVS